MVNHCLVEADPLTFPATTLPPRGDGRPLTLFDCVRSFFGFASPLLIAGGILAALAGRIALGDWGWGDALVAAGLIAFQPFSEWLIHVGLLHTKPRKVGRWTVDLPTARLHRWHHRHPTVLRGVLIPWWGIVTFLVMITATMWVITIPAWLLSGQSHLALTLTASFVGYCLLGVYEWCHFLIHTPYRPRRRPYKVAWRNHRLHHFKNEHFWFGVSSDVGDRALGTSPDFRTVPKSRTVRNLGIE